MKNLKNKKGFTLIELLAVIVVLAIVTVIATQSILPLIANTNRDAFASEANMAIGAAADATSLISIGSVNTNYTPVKDATGKLTGYCFTLQNLKDLGFFDKDLGPTGTPVYEGTVTVTFGTGNSYTYAVSMHNDAYYVNTTSGDVVAKDYDATNEKNGVAIYDKNNAPTLKLAC